MMKALNNKVSPNNFDSKQSFNKILWIFCMYLISSINLLHVLERFLDYKETFFKYKEKILDEYINKLFQQLIKILFILDIGTFRSPEDSEHEGLLAQLC